MGNEDDKNPKKAPAEENPFADTINSFKIKAQKPRTKRVNVSLPLLVELEGKSIRANLVDISAKGLKIDQPIATLYAQKCNIVLMTEVPITLSCTPFIGPHEFNERVWTRLKFNSEINFEKILGLIQKAATILEQKKKIG